MTGERDGELSDRLEHLYRSYHQALLNYLYRLVGDSSQAEELAQEVFVRALRALGRLPEDANHRAWLYRIATNLAYDRLRRRRLLTWLPLLDGDQDAPVSPTVERKTESGWAEQEAVQQALQELPAKYRAPLILFSMQEYSVREISQALGLSEGAVKTRLYRAREMFRKAYAQED